MSTSTCSLLRYLSNDTWSRIQFVRARKGLKIYEVTITQNLIYDLHRKGANSVVRIYEATDEDTNGNDIEFFVKTQGGYLFFPVQAKIIYPNLKYPRMEHGNQINDLRNYAKNNGGLPLYLLYNYAPQFSFNGEINGIHCDGLDFGCTLVSAEFLFNNFAFRRTDKNGHRRWIIPGFNDLHTPHAIPWFIPFCADNTESDRKRVFLKSVPHLANDRSSELKIYSESEIESGGWSPLNLEKSPVNDLKSGFRMTLEKFSPKFRFVFS